MDLVTRKTNRLTTKLWRDYKIKTQVNRAFDPNLQDGKILLLNRLGVCIRFCSISGDALSVETHDSGGVVVTEITSVADIYRVTGDLF